MTHNAASGRCAASLSAAQLDLRRLRRRRPAHRRHLHAHRDGQARRRRPTGLLTDVLARLQDHPARRFAELLPWN
jgi:hypothetical protein